MESRAEVAYSAHILVLTTAGWGHLRPLCAFSAKIVQQRSDVAITFLMAGNKRKLIEQEISRYFSDSNIDFGAAGNIRIVNICVDHTLDQLGVRPLIVQAFPSFYDSLLNFKPVQCLQTKMTFDAIRIPNSIILDNVRSMTDKRIPVFAWVTGCASASLRIIGPEKLGGFGDVETKASALVKTTGRTLEEVIDELYHPHRGKVISVPGLPPMYDYEWFPQEELSPNTPTNKLFSAAYYLARGCDGFLCATSATFESESLEAIRTWLAETNRPVYAIGPLVPPGFGNRGGLSSVAKQKEFDSSKDGDEFQVFLDKTLKNCGERSLVYISFGSFWWPKNKHAWAFVDTLLELNFPFILSHPSPKAVVPPGYAEKIKKSGIGFLSAWCPQQSILTHQVTGWFLTHCGQNSVIEALAQGIPMIAWPLRVDQPANAAHLTLNLDVAFEMVEVRTGPGLKPLHRGARPTGTIEAIMAEARSVLERARGPEGERKRRNAEVMQYKFKQEWEEGGDALNNLRKFLNDNCSGN